ncbi:MAG TPA: hypothetical protein VM425_18865 [Myxococcota bacterium]|nr:hypothetical protein [Myxococcota bacterium]
MKSRLFSIFVVSLSCMPARAADTTETWDAGAADVDFYMGYDGIGRGEDERVVAGDIMIGYGLVDRLSAYLGLTLEAADLLSKESGDLRMGIFGTPLDSDHFDADLFIEIGATGPAFSEFRLEPALELNFDLEPDRSGMGLYFRTALPLRSRSRSSSSNNGDNSLAFDIEGVLGAYVTVAAGHQLLAEFDAVFHQHPDDVEQAIDIGGIAFGYNVVLNPAIEFISQFYINIPNNNERFSAGVMIGLIATIPVRPRASMKLAPTEGCAP